MSILGTIFGNLVGSATASGVATAANGLGDAAIKIRQAITNDITADKKAEIELELVKIEAAAALAQNEVNKIEASSGSLFVAGARPAAMWVCVIGLAYSFLAQPVFSWLSVNFGIISPPVIDSDTLLTLIMGMLGLGTMRTFEKMKNAQGNH